VEAIRHGNRIPITNEAQTPDGANYRGTSMVRGVSEQGELVALMEVSAEQNEWQPKKVFFS
jgi:tRNA U55 pseudouridine synthase TruB